MPSPATGWPLTSRRPYTVTSTPGSGLGSLTQAVTRIGETVGARVKVGRAVAGGGRLATGVGSARGRVAVGTLGGRVSVLTAIKGVADGASVGAGVYVCGAVMVCGVRIGVGRDDANVAAGEGAPGVRVAVGTVTSTLDVAVASGLAPRVGVADGPAGRDGVGDGAGGVTAHAVNTTLSKRIGTVCLTFIHPSGLSKRLSTASVSQGKARAAAASVPQPGGMISRRRG